MTALDLALDRTRPGLPFAKRGIDLLLASCLLVGLAPLLALIALLVRLDSPGPVLYRQWRIGLGGRRFRMWKYRSMVVGADDELEEILRGRPGERLNWTQYQKLWNDPRLTRLGISLRRWSLDELPQLWNVLRGEMSLVGPRPILPSQQEIYGPQLSLYQQVRPGMTGLWQVSGRNRTSFAQRVVWDVRYIKNWGLLLDARILFKTIGAILYGDGAY